MAINIFKMQDMLKNMSKDQLLAEAQNPTGSAPAFMVHARLAEVGEQEKEAMRSASAQDTSTVAQDVVQGAGVGGIGAMSQALNPRAQNSADNGSFDPRTVQDNTGGRQEPIRMAEGGAVNGRNAFQGVDQLDVPVMETIDVRMPTPTIGLDSLAAPQRPAAPPASSPRGPGPARDSGVARGLDAALNDLATAGTNRAPRGTMLNGVMYELLDNNTVRESRSGQTAPPDIANAVRARLQPPVQLSPALGSGVNPSYEEASGGRFPAEDALAADRDAAAAATAEANIIQRPQQRPGTGDISMAGAFSRGIAMQEPSPARSPADFNGLRERADYVGDSARDALAAGRGVVSDGRDSVDAMRTRIDGAKDNIQGGIASVRGQLSDRFDAMRTPEQDTGPAPRGASIRRQNRPEVIAGPGPDAGNGPRGASMRRQNREYEPPVAGAPKDYGSMDLTRLEAERRAAGSGGLGEFALNAAEGFTGAFRGFGARVQDSIGDTVSSLGAPGVGAFFNRNADDLNAVTDEYSQNSAGRDADRQREVAQLNAAIAANGGAPSLPDNASVEPLADGTLPGDLLPPAPAPTSTSTSTSTPAATQPGPSRTAVQSGGNGGGGIAGIAAKAANSSSKEMSSYDTLLADALTENKADQKQAKWLMLAEIGAGMLGSTKPGFAGTGDAVSAGLGSYNAAKDALKAEAMGIASMGEDRRRYEQNREDQFTMAAMQAAAARGRGAASARRIPVGVGKLLSDRREMLVAELSTLQKGPVVDNSYIPFYNGTQLDPNSTERDRVTDAIAAIDQQYNALLSSYVGGGGVAPPTDDLTVNAMPK